MDIASRENQTSVWSFASPFTRKELGSERPVIEEHAVGDSRIGIGRIGAVGARQGIVEADTMAYKDGKPGGFDPHKRIPDMDADGIDEDITDQSSIRPSATLAGPSPQSSAALSSHQFAKPSPANAAARPNPHRRPAARRCPAGSFFGGFRTPAPTPGRLLALSRHPKPYPEAASLVSGRC
jgi:hypothetical protein